MILVFDLQGSFIFGRGEPLFITFLVATGIFSANTNHPIRHNLAEFIGTLIQPHRWIPLVVNIFRQNHQTHQIHQGGNCCYSYVILITILLLGYLNLIITLPETNIAPENGWLEYSFPFGIVYFQVLC